MPCAPRSDKKMTKLAYAIIGMPSNMSKMRGDKEVDRRLLMQKTYRMR